MVRSEPPQQFSSGIHFPCASCRALYNPIIILPSTKWLFMGAEWCPPVGSLPSPLLLIQSVHVLGPTLQSTSQNQKGKRPAKATDQLSRWLAVYPPAELLGSSELFDLVPTQQKTLCDNTGQNLEQQQQHRSTSSRRRRRSTCTNSCWFIKTKIKDLLRS